MLLFPGGIREALHGPGEDYQLFWPSKTDFVRVAARFDAVVVPFGGVGADDSAQAWQPSALQEVDGVDGYKHELRSYKPISIEVD